jgi:hypothetical protein
MKVTNLKPENAKALVMLIAGLAAVVILVVYINKTFGGIGKLFSGITDGLGLTDSAATAATKAAVANAKQQANNIASPWSPQFYKNAPPGAMLLTQSSADALAAQIWDSTGIFTSDIEQVFGAIKQLSAQSQLSFIADRFNALYNQDLFSWITLQYTKMGTPDPELQNIIDYVNSLSKY